MGHEAPPQLTGSHFKTKQTSSPSLPSHYLYFRIMWGQKCAFYAFQIKMHSVPESVAHLWPSIVFKWLKSFGAEQVSETCQSQNFERLGLPRHKWSTTQVLHEENLVLLAFWAATTQCMQEILTCTGICYFTAFHNSVYFFAVQNTSLKSVGPGGTLHFAVLNPETISLASFRIKLTLGCILKPPMDEHPL